MIVTGAIVSLGLTTARIAHAESFLDPAGPVAQAQMIHWWRAIAILCTAVVPVLVLVPFFLWRYRYRRPRGLYAPDWQFSLPLDIAMWLTPLVIIATLGVWLIRDTYALDPWLAREAGGQQVRVQVVGLDWKWLFIYPDLNIATVGEMAFPAGADVAFEITSDTVMQSFIISRLGGQIYAMPGMKTQLHLVADAPGTFQGENMQYNGRGFAQQKFAARAMSQTGFDDWVARVRADGVPLDTARYAVLARRSTMAEAQAALEVTGLPDGIMHFSDVPPAFFDGVVTRYHGGTSVPVTAQPGATGYVEALRIMPLGLCMASVEGVR